MALAAEVIDRVNQALDGADSWFAVYSRLREAVPDGEEVGHRSLIWAFGYMLLGPDRESLREREGSGFGPLMEMDGQRIPPRVSDVPDEDVETWAEAFDAIDDSRLRSRLGDLLWERKHQPRPDQKARGACNALLALASDEQWGPMEATEGLVRALELAKSVSDDHLYTQVIAAMEVAIDAELKGDEDRPGIPFRLLRELVTVPSASRPTELRKLIEEAQARYGDDPHHAETAIELLVEVAPDEREQLRRAQVEIWREASSQADGILRVAFLEQALEIARNHGLADEAKEIRVELGSIPEEELDLKTVSSEIKVDSEEVEKHLALFTEFDDWRQSLARYGIYGPPGGEPDKLDDEVSKLMQASPLQFLVTKAVIDPDTQLAIFHAADDASHRLVARAQQRMLAARLWGVFAAEILLRFEAKYGRPDKADLTSYFTSAFIDESLAERIACSFHLWWDGLPDESAHVLAPRLEAVVRELARQLGIPIMREPVGEKPGGVRSLGDLLFALEGRLPTAGWHAYLHHLLSDSLGLNLRNVIGHGMRPQISAEDAALLLHAACFLRLVAPGDADQSEPSAD